MKTRRIIASIITIFCTFIATAQVSITVNVPTAGGLRTAIIAAGGDKSTITNLTVTGNIDVRDVKFMRDSMPVLALLDIGAVQIKAYNGVGTSYHSTVYPAKEMPAYSFYYFDLVSQQGTPKITLTSIRLPNNLTSIGDGAFVKCTGLTGNLNIPNSVTSIGGDAFDNCTGLTGTLSLPAALKTIGMCAFLECSGLTGSLVIPNSVTSIGQNAFNFCGFTGNLILSASLTSVGDAFSGLSFTGDLIIPDLLTSGGFGSGFTSCYIPNPVTSIIYLGGCTNLTKVVVNKTVPLSIDNNTFHSAVKSTCELIVPAGTKSAYQAADVWKDFTNITEAIFVTLNTQGGHPAKPITTTLTNATIAAPNNPIRDGYSFAGWYKEAVCTNVWDFATDTVPAPVTLYAKWTANPANSFTVTFNANGGSLVLDITATSNTSITAPTAPTKTGFTFAGWYKEAACTNAWNFATDVVTANITLFAKWTTVTFVENRKVTDFKLYPNPAKDKLYINFNSPNFSGAIFDLQGKRVVEIMAGATQIDISNLSKGVYLVKIIDSGNITMEKLIKE